jgi:hypothetical protein
MIISGAFDHLWIFEAETGVAASRDDHLREVRSRGQFFHGSVTACASSERARTSLDLKVDLLPHPAMIVPLTMQTLITIARIILITPNIRG